MQSSDDSRGSRFDSGVALFKAKQIDEALTYFEESLSLDLNLTPSRSAKAHYYIAECHFSKRDYEKAMWHYNISVDLNPDDFQVYFDRGYLRQKLRMTHASIEDFDRSIELNPEFASTYHNRGVAYKQLGNIEKAVEDFRKAIALSGTHVRTKKSLLDLLLPKALSLSESGRYADALAILDECVQLDTVPVQVFIERATVHMALQRYADAVDDYTLALEQRPFNSELLKGRAEAYQKAGETRLAMADYMALLDAKESRLSSRTMGHLMPGIRNISIS